MAKSLVRITASVLAAVLLLNPALEAFPGPTMVLSGTHALKSNPFDEEALGAPLMSGLAALSHRAKLFWINVILRDDPELDIADIGLQTRFGSHDEVNALIRDDVAHGLFEDHGFIRGVQVYRNSHYAYLLQYPRKGHSGITHNRIFVMGDTSMPFGTLAHEFAELKLWQAFALVLAGEDPLTAWNWMEFSLERRQKLNKDLRDHLGAMHALERRRLRKRVEDEAERNRLVHPENYDLSASLARLGRFQEWLPETHDPFAVAWRTPGGAVIQRVISNFNAGMPYNERAKELVERIGLVMRGRGNDPFNAPHLTIRRLANYMALKVPGSLPEEFLKRLKMISEIAESCPSDVSLSNFLRIALPLFIDDKRSLAILDLTLESALRSARAGRDPSVALKSGAGLGQGLAPEYMPEAFAFGERMAARPAEIIDRVEGSLKLLPILAEPGMAADQFAAKLSRLEKVQDGMQSQDLPLERSFWDELRVLLVALNKTPERREELFRVLELLVVRGFRPDTAISALAGLTEKRYPAWLQLRAQRVTFNMLERGADPGPLLQHVPALAAIAGNQEDVFKFLVSRAAGQCVYAAEHGIVATNELAEGLLETIEAAGNREWVISDALAVGRSLVDQGVDPAALFKAASAYAAVAGPRRHVYQELLAKGRADLCLLRGGEGWPPAKEFGALAASFSKIMAQNQDGFLQLQDLAVSRLQDLQTSGIKHPRAMSAVLSDILPVVGGNKDLVEKSLDLGVALDRHKLTLSNLVLKDVVRLASGRPGFLEAALRLAELQARQGVGPEGLLKITIMLASNGPSGPVLRSRLADLDKIITSKAIAGVEDRTWPAAAELGAMLQNWPGAWESLIFPTIQGQRIGAFLALETYKRLTPYLRAEEDLVMLRKIAAEKGVQAWDILQNVIYAGLRNHKLASLKQEAPTLNEFIDHFPFMEIELYEAFRTIRQSSEMRADQDAAIERLKEELVDLKAAILDGNVTPGQSRDARFPILLYHLFPPAVTTTRDQYMGLFRDARDYPEHLVKWNPGPVQDWVFDLRQGSYQVASGQTISDQAWSVIHSAVLAVHGTARTTSESLDELGSSLLDAWVSGTLARDKRRADLMARIYRQYRRNGPELPKDLSTVPALLAYKEFVGERLREEVRAALEARRKKNSSTYDAAVTKKITPSEAFGEGLVAAVWNLVLKRRAQKDGIDDLTFRRALQSILRDFRIESDPAIELFEDAKSA